MWATTSTTQTPFFPFPKPPQPPPPPPPTTIQLQRIPRHVATTATSSENTSGLGQAVLSAIKSSPSNKKVQQKHQDKPNNNKKINNSESEISGSDILRALQKANIKKQQQKKSKGPGSGSGDLKSNNNEKKKVVDYDKIRPVSVKGDWATRLNDLEKRLQEFLPH